MDPDPYSTFLFAISTQAFSADVVFYIILLIILLCFSAAFSGSETAFFSLSRQKLDEFSQSKNMGRLRVYKLMQKPQKLLATILVGNNMVNIAIVILSEYIIRRSFDFGDSEIVRFLVSVVAATLLLLFFGEVFPKVFASVSPAVIAKSTGGFLNIMASLLYIFTKPLLLISDSFESRSKKAGQNTISVDELEQAFEASGQVSENEEDKRMLEGIISFGKTEAKQIMTPRINMVALESTSSFEKVKRLIQKTAYSRIPVYDENPDRIAGVLYIKDLLKYINEKNFDWTKLLRTPFFVPENRKIDDILIDFQERKTHIAIVVDEYGGTAGIISMDDIIAEIVGEISDEFDDDENQITEHSDGKYTLDGQLSLIDFYRALELTDEEEKLFEAEKGEADSLAGFILEQAGVFPKKGEKISFGKYVFTISSLDKKRIKQITLDIENKDEQNGKKSD